MCSVGEGLHGRKALDTNKPPWKSILGGFNLFLFHNLLGLLLDHIILSLLSVRLLLTL